MTRKEESVSLEKQLATAEQHLYPNYGQPSLVMDRGEGSQLWDTEGRRYIDFFGGIAVSCLGHAHKGIVEALQLQASKLIHLTNYFYNAPNIELAGKICALTGMDRAFFCNSGTEANEAALKLTRRHFYNLGETNRDVVLAFENSFHGRTLGALTVTGQEKYRTGFGPLAGAVHAPFGDLQSTASLLTDKVAGIIVEPVQGEGGVIPAPAGFLQGLRELCDKSGALLIVDEIQTGVGRTGKFLASQHVDVRPDVLTLAKALGGGVPIGAMLCTEALKDSLSPGSHGTTFGGNPLASAAALAVLSALEEENLVERAGTMGDRLKTELQRLANKHASVACQRGQGLLQALVLERPAEGVAIWTALRQAGLLVTFVGGVALRMTPALNISDSEFGEGISILDQVLGDFS